MSMNRTLNYMAQILASSLMLTTLLGVFILVISGLDNSLLVCQANIWHELLKDESQCCPDVPLLGDPWTAASTCGLSRDTASLQPLLSKSTANAKMYNTGHQQLIFKNPSFVFLLNSSLRIKGNGCSMMWENHYLVDHEKRHEKYHF